MWTPASSTIRGRIKRSHLFLGPLADRCTWIIRKPRIRRARFGCVLHLTGFWTQDLFLKRWRDWRLASGVPSCLQEVLGR